MKTLASFKRKDYAQALKDIYIRIDEMLVSSYGKTKLKSYTKAGESASPFSGGAVGDDIALGCGCTANSAIITPDMVYVGNSGDSRAIAAKLAGKKYEAIEMSIDHKPDNPEEKKRIEKAGGFVEENRVKGILNLSRSLGDLEYKQDKKLSPENQMITAMPEIKTLAVTPDVKFLFIACDGIWDCLTSQEAAEFIGERIEKYRKTGKLSGIVEQMFDTIIASDVASSEGIGCDNMTAVIVMFKNDE